MAITISGMKESTFGELISVYAPDELHLFDSLRVFIEENGNFWFIGSEVAEIMGYQNPWKAIRDHVPDQYKIEVPNESYRPNDSFGRLNGKSDTILISELGLYSLSMRSKLPQAYQFQDWVYRVISRIRQYGGYISPDPRLKQVVDIIPEHLRPAFSNMIETKNRVINEQSQMIHQQNEIINKMKNTIDDLQYKADYYDIAMDNSNVVPMTVIAKDFGMSANELHYILFSLHVIYKVGSTWVLYQEHQDRGYTASKNKMTLTDGEGKVCGSFEIATYWTQKGKEFIYEKLIANGYPPRYQKTD